MAVKTLLTIVYQSLNEWSQRSWLEVLIHSCHCTYVIMLTLFCLIYISNRGDFYVMFNPDDNEDRTCKAFDLFENACFELAYISRDTKLKKDATLYKNLLYSQMLFSESLYSNSSYNKD